ncbi:MAG: glycosyltransferase family 9 protein [Fimbriimonas sp.]|nr:glycosyltransferase family 9 protein [Fimbriimonas sp.]
MSRDPERIGVFRIGNLGDTIVALPALWTVRKRFPNAKITYLTQQSSGQVTTGTEVLRAGAVYDEWMSYKSSSEGASKLDMLKLLAKLRSKRLDMLVYLPSHRTPQQLDRDEKFFRMAGVKQIVGMTGFRETDYRPGGSPLPTVRREVDVLLGHLKRDGVFTSDSPNSLTHLGLTEDERAFAETWLTQNGIDTSKPVIALGAGSKMPAKLWPLNRFIEVGKKLQDSRPSTFLLFGSPAERGYLEEFERQVPNSRNIAGDLTIRQSAAVFEHCDMYLGNDTGTMHIAAATGVPCVAIFSARDWPGRWYPYGDQHVVHRFATPCEGCLLQTCDRQNECLTAIQSDAVYESARKTLELSRLARGNP